MGEADMTTDQFYLHVMLGLALLISAWTLLNLDGLSKWPRICTFIGVFLIFLSALLGFGPVVLQMVMQ